MISILLIFTVSNCVAQIDSIRTIDYSLADSIALNFPKKKYKSNEELARVLTKDLTNEYDKFRVIFRWISDNIEYRKGRYGKDPDKIIKQKKAVCEGYSHLLKGMCNAVGIDCEVIVGFSKTRAMIDINKSFKETDHSWNAVKLNDQWYLTDITWASGYYNRKKRKSIKYFNEAYFLPDPNFFILKHYPEDEKWLLTDTIFNKRTFKKGPIYHSAFNLNGVKLIDSPKGKLKNVLTLTFSAKTEIEKLSIGFDNQKYAKNLDFLKDGEVYLVNYKFEKGDYGECTVFFNGKAILSFLKK